MWLSLFFHRRRRRGSRSRAPTENDIDIPSVFVSQARHGRTGTNLATDDDASSSRENHMPLLYHLARSWAWQAVAFRCQTHPHEASTSYTDYHGDNVLHWTAFGRPPLDVVEQLLRSCPSLAKLPNKKGQLPLHVACCYRASSEVIAAILESYPDAAAMPDAAGSYPLHLLCDFGSSRDGLASILCTTGGASTIDKSDGLYQRRPLAILNARKNLNECQRARDAMRRLRKNQRARRTLLARESPEDTALRERQEREEEQKLAHYRNQETWQRAALLLLVEYTRKPLDSQGCELEDVRVLHAAIGNQECPASLQEFAILLYQDSLISQDEKGRVPLHLAAESGNPALLQEVLVACPDAASVRDDEGLLPLVVAINSRNPSWTRGLGLLTEEYPDALEELSLVDSLYPHIWSKLSSHSALFQAVRACPRVFGGDNSIGIA